MVGRCLSRLNMLSAAPALRAAVLFAFTMAPALAPGKPAAYPEKFAVLHIIALIFASFLVFISNLLNPGKSAQASHNDADLEQPPAQWRLDVAKVMKWSGIIFIGVFALVRVAYSSAPYSPMWRPNCGDWDVAESGRLRAATSLRTERLISGQGGRRHNQAPTSLLRHGTRNPSVGGTGQLCIAYNTVPRPHRYLTQSVWTLFQGLGDGDMDMLASPVLLVTSSSNHSEANEILERFGPQVEVRKVPAASSSTINSMEPDEERLWRESWDYAHTVEECQKTGAAYALILEDDVISGPRLIRKALDNAQRLEKKRANQWFSLRLWASDKFAGWESTPREIGELVGLAVTGGLAIAVAFSAATNIRSLVVASFVWATWAVGLVILQEAVGRQYCLPSFRPGLSLDYRNGAHGSRGSSNGYAGVVSGVAQLFPMNSEVNGLPAYLKRQAGKEQCDTLVRAYLTDRGKNLEQWMVWPPLVQHIGRESSVGHTGEDWHCRGLPMATAFVGEEGTVLG
eukprot:gnl/MRDRNA2_/MRDRNA2_133342_c0_seq1.p1 gnl/MRDRNA2_/MRDRNA2_133342_c0~~gnl/MRDRNA2_/MRDRNA2_133342_c0_seq1.p1  ORF type:complete len:512 (+),score=55.32 gnl/MRDRNA2_/MRDRNA2_133342_c0_seq1:23-1558(+)